MINSLIFIIIVFLVIAISGKIKFKKTIVKTGNVENSKIDISSDNSNIKLSNIKDLKINIK